MSSHIMVTGSRSGGGWGPAELQNGHDVLLPLELEDLARSVPRADSSSAYRAAWLLRKAALFHRLACTDPEITDEARRISRVAEETGLRLQRTLARDLEKELLTDDESPDGCPRQEIIRAGDRPAGYRPTMPRRAETVDGKVS